MGRVSLNKDILFLKPMWDEKLFFSTLKPSNAYKDLTFTLVLYQKAVLVKSCHDFDHAMDAKKNQG